MLLIVLMKMSKEIKGNKTYRHDRNPLEKQLHDSFIKSNGSVEDMSMICLSSNDGMRPDRYLTDEECSIVISTVQWLGSHVGQSFLRENGFELKENV